MQELGVSQAVVAEREKALEGALERSRATQEDLVTRATALADREKAAKVWVHEGGGSRERRFKAGVAEGGGRMKRAVGGDPADKALHCTYCQ